jgi:hypothetical protein
MKLSKVAALALVGLAGCGAHAEDTQSLPHRGSPDPAGSTSSSDPGSSGSVPDAGTAHVPAAPLSLDGAAANVGVDENLDRLRALALFEVLDLIANRARAAERLANFADAAVKAAATPYSGYACSAHVDVNLEALRSLEVVGVGAFLRTLPENNPTCDNSPCPEDIAVADANNETRAARLESVALAVQGI